MVSDRYFETLAITLVAGRTFDENDGLETERVALVNRAMAERAWPGRNPIGQQLAAPSMEDWMYDGASPWLAVIGVVDDVRHRGHEFDTQPELYVLYRQVPRWNRGMNVVVRGAETERATLSAAVHDAIRASDPSLAVEIGWLDERVAGLLRERIATQRVLAGWDCFASCWAARLG